MMSLTSLRRPLTRAWLVAVIILPLAGCLPDSLITIHSADPNAPILPGGLGPQTASQPQPVAEPQGPVRGGGGRSPWSITRSPLNPIIPVAENPYEAVSQYVPAPLQLPDGETWIYVKGDSTGKIWAWRNTLPNAKPAFVGLALDKGQAGEWDSAYVVDPVTVYDEASDTIHLWYKGTSMTAGGMQAKWAWGHATAAGKSPTAFTKDPANPILTADQVQARLGGGEVTDVMPSSVIRIGGVFCFYGHYFSDGTIKLFLSKGTTWNDPVPAATILRPGEGHTLVQCPSVFRQAARNRYGMIFTEGDVDPHAKRELKLAWSSDGLSWPSRARLLMEPSPDDPWESMRVYGATLLTRGRDNYDEPVLQDGKMMLYYSGSNQTEGSSLDQTGLAYVEPKRLSPPQPAQGK